MVARGGENLRILFVLLCVISLGTLILGSAANADESPNADSPVAVSNILVGSDADKITWATCISFTNKTQRVIEAVKFEFDFQDAFDTTVGKYDGDRVGQFAPGVLIEGPDSFDVSGFGNVVQKAPNCWVYPQHIASLSSVKVRVLKVRYGDGTIWVNDNPTSVFVGKYMADTGNSPHPTYIMCGWVKVRYEVVALYPESQCWKKFQAWQSEQASPSPSPAPSSTSSAEPMPVVEPTERPMDTPRLRKAVTNLFSRAASS